MTGGHPDRSSDTQDTQDWGHPDRSFGMMSAGHRASDVSWPQSPNVRCNDVGIRCYDGGIICNDVGIRCYDVGIRFTDVGI